MRDCSCRRTANGQHASLCRSAAEAADRQQSGAVRPRGAQPARAVAASTLPLHGDETWRAPTLPSSAGISLPHANSGSSSSSKASGSTSRGSRTGWLVSIMSVPLLIALVATGFWGLQLQNRLSSQGSQLTELQSELANFGSGTTSVSAFAWFRRTAGGGSDRHGRRWPSWDTPGRRQ